MKEENSKRKAKEYLSQEPIINSYQIARLDDERSEVFLDDESDPSAVMIISDGTVTVRGGKTAVRDSLLDHLEKDKEYRFHAVDPQSFKAIEEVITVKDDRPTWLLIRMYEKAEEPDVEIVPLKKEDASVINEYWGLGSQDSMDYIKSRIEEGPACGIKTGSELIGWNLTHFLTDEVMVMGMLHVKEKWRRRGYAKALAEALCKEGERRGLVPAVQIFKDNEASLSLAEDLGFEIRAEHHWFGGSLKG